MTTGFIGLGNLGTVMVDNLIERNVQLHLYNRSQEKMQSFSDKAQLHASIPSLAHNRFLVNHNRGRKDWDWASIVEVIQEENKS